MTGDYEIYSIDNLNPKDKLKLEGMDHMRSSILSRSIVDDFLDEKDVGQAIKNIYKDTLDSFIKFLSEKTEYIKVDFIVDCIESYETLGNTKKSKNSVEFEK